MSTSPKSPIRESPRKTSRLIGAECIIRHVEPYDCNSEKTVLLRSMADEGLPFVGGDCFAVGEQHPTHKYITLCTRVKMPTEPLFSKSLELSMGTINPYAQAGWFNPDNQTPFSHQPWTLSSPISPIFGALPPFPSENSPDWIRLTFVSADGDILDCSVVGARQQIFFEISTESFENKPTATTFAKKDGTVLSRIEWAVTPTVEIENVLSKRPVCEWITRSPEAKHARVIHLSTGEYVWERYKQIIYLYRSGNIGGDPELCAKFHRKGDFMLLDVTPKAISFGVLEPAIVALMLLTEHHGSDGTPKTAG